MKEVGALLTFKVQHNGDVALLKGRSSAIQLAQVEDGQGVHLCKPNVHSDIHWDTTAGHRQRLVFVITNAVSKCECI